MEANPILGKLIEMFSDFSVGPPVIHQSHSTINQLPSNLTQVVPEIIQNSIPLIQCQDEFWGRMEEVGFLSYFYNSF